MAPSDLFGSSENGNAPHVLLVAWMVISFSRRQPLDYSGVIDLKTDTLCF